MLPSSCRASAVAAAIPTLLKGSLIPDLRRVTDRTLGLRALIEAYRDAVATVEIAESPVEVNLNTPAEYEAALVAFTRGDWAEPAISPDPS